MPEENFWTLWFTVYIVYDVWLVVKFSSFGGCLGCCVQMANNILQQVQQLKLLIEQARHQFENGHDSVIDVLRSQFEKEKNEASCLSLGLVISVFSFSCGPPSLK